MPIFELHVHIHNDESKLLGRLAQLQSSIDGLVKQGAEMDTDVQAIIDEVAQVKGDVASTKAFIAGLEQKINDILAGENLKPETREALKTAFTDLSGASQDLKAAIDNDPTT